jgi:hypothetical protein
MWYGGGLTWHVWHVARGQTAKTANSKQQTGAMAPWRIVVVVRSACGATQRLF